MSYQERSRIRTPDHLDRMDIGKNDFISHPHYNDLFDSENWKKMYGNVVRMATFETEAPGANTDVLRSINFTIGVLMAIQKGQTIEELHHDLFKRVKGSLVARSEAVNGIKYAWELGICKIKFKENDINQLKLAIIASENKSK